MEKIEKNIILTGFMGSGKTTVGKFISKKTGFKFIDTDELIEKKEKKKIVEIFNDKGEKYFRRLESKVVDEVSDLRNAVISCGGGLILNKVNIKKLKKSGTIFYLKVPEDELIERLKNVKDRPLIKYCDRKIKIKKLLKERENTYEESSDYIIKNGKIKLNKTADYIMKKMIKKDNYKYVINLSKKSEILIGSGLLEDFARIGKVDEKKVCLITDINIHRLYGKVIEDSLGKNGIFPDVFIVKRGEGSKTLGTVKRILD
ncbi:MAG: AAA family ATPase, partial [Actinomycetia bacterium]|nr:AAA family ATPase [Actinomycetes bacterium]